MECGCAIENLLKKNFSLLSFQEKLELVQVGRPTPKLPNMTCVSKCRGRSFSRHFQSSNYDEKSWLCGCSLINKLFCWPCLLFTTSKERGVWTSGYSDLNHLATAMNKHQLTQAHINSVVSLKTFGNTRIEFSLDEQQKIATTRHNQQVSENRKILERLIDCVCFLGTQELAFRGNDESQSSNNKGNYKELLNLLAKYDNKLERHLTTATTFTGTSSSIQNELINAVASVISDCIEEEINKSSFISVMLDETTDIGKKSQLSLVFRYVDGNGLPRERFYKFWDLSADRSAAAISNKIINIIKMKNWGDKLVAQTYDGAAVMASDLNGTQAKVRENFPQAAFIHCNAHVLNLVLSQSPPLPTLS
ncbi:zinc finger MYM-type protein 1-like [Teleopsis dalmanni]|uniref:zinc finger MYM-type protein 1-like n=1 Tax=Teleopsis dalmanni TaxID=139649 RepID=UPI0018CD0D43|nr:zinc finger MYM-type protein 1-like [Teleopsis dalmanni]